MRKINETKYYVRTSNPHLLNILDENYYIELGIIDMTVLTKLLKLQILDLKQVMYYDLLNVGIGQIIEDCETDVYYQLNYLLSLRQKSSSSKFFLTCGTITYFDDFGCEKYAPLVLIPVEIDYRGSTIAMSGLPLANRQLVKLLARKFRETIEEQNRFLDIYMGMPLNTVGQFDKFMQELSNETKYSYSPACYLTVFDIEYQDFTINNEYFNVERSIYETTDKAITNKYFDTIYGVLPTNIDQKYVILKVANGDSFAIDGRLGTGKTHTVLNILADSIRKDKHVLYVNQDLDNIWDVEKNLKFLDLGQYIYNLTKNSREIEVPKMDLPSLSGTKISEEEYELLWQFERIFDKRLNGLSISYILETFATLKNQGFDRVKINIESSLQKHEIEYLYQNLKKIEQGFEVITSYNDNIWKKLNISHNNFTVPEIIERTNHLNDIQIKLNKETESFCKKYQLHIPKTVSDLDRLVNHIIRFSMTKPIAKWENLDVRNAVKDALVEIQDLSDLNYNITKYYEQNLNENYNPGRALTILKELCANNIKVKDITVEDKNKYIDNLLDDNTKLQTLVKQIRLNNEKIKECEKQLNDIFNDKELSKKINIGYYNFFIKFSKYIEEYFTLNSWTNVFLFNHKNYLNIGKKVKDLYNKSLKIRAEYVDYLINYNSLFFSEISELIHNRRFNQIIKRYFDQRLIKNKHINMNDIIQKVKNYYELVRQTVTYITDPDYSENKTIEELMRNYVGLYDFVDGLDNNYLKLLENVFTRYNKTIINLEPLRIVLVKFIDECDKTNSLAEVMENFNISIDGQYGYEKYRKLNSYIPYLERVIELKKEINKTFKKHSQITSAHLFELIKYDMQYLDVQKIIHENDERYHSLLGDNYREFDTVISEVGQTLEHFADFIERLDDTADVNTLFQEPTLSRLIDNAMKINGLLNDWLQCFKAFSICFRGGMGALQVNSLKENIELLKQYVKTTNHIEHILFINEIIKKCNLLNLNDLLKLIENASPTVPLANYFLCSTLQQLYSQICEEYPQILDFTNYESLIKKLRLVEFDYCIKNINSLKKQEERRTKTRLANVAFDDYNKIVEILIRYVPIFLADVNILNSNIDLSQFDLVIIDDGHLSSANKYNRLKECKQCVVFGDKSFQSSYVNTLMKRISETAILPYRNRYIKMSSHFNNTWTTNNRYIYSFDTKIVKKMVKSVESFSSSVVELFSRNQKHIINVVVGTETTRREVYTNIVKILEKYYSSNDIIDILCYNIRIINAVCEGSRYVNDVVIYYNDFLDLEQNKKELIFKNFIVVSNGIYIYYVGGKIEENNNVILTNINNTIGKVSNRVKHLDGISSLLSNRLKDKGVIVKEGFGRFDFILKDKENVGIIIVGKDHKDNHSLIDNYQYYHDEYIKNGWKVEIIYIIDLINSFDDIVDKLITKIRGNENASK